MTRSAVAVFGALRHADERELEAWEITVRARLRKMQTAAALRELVAGGFVVRRVEGRRRLFRINTTPLHAAEERSAA